MIRVRDLRFITSVCMIGLAALAIKPALNLARFGWLNATGADAERLAVYSDTRGARTFALEALLRQPQTAEKGVAVASDYLRVRPLSALGWLGLARFNILGTSDYKAGLSAIAMSNVAGPNEGVVMAGRAALLVPLWRLLTPDMRRGAADDLARAWALMAETDREGVVNAVAKLGPAERVNLRAVLLLEGDQAVPVLAALGLDRDEAPPPTSPSTAGRGR
jgi:HEAT repeat protein